MLHFFALFVHLLRRGQVFFYFQLSGTDWVFVSADFRILKSNDNINTFLTKLLNTSVTLFLHILWRDSHSWSTTPRTYLKIIVFLPMIFRMKSTMTRDPVGKARTRTFTLTPGASSPRNGFIYHHRKIVLYMSRRGGNDIIMYCIIILN